MWRGEITVECDNDECSAEVVYRYDDLDNCTINDRLAEDGWQDRKSGKVWLWFCPDCVEEQEREKGDDDGKEYGHPADALAERL